MSLSSSPLWQFITTAKFLFFINLFASFLIMGSVISILGPSLLELGEQTNSKLNQLVYIFSARSFGFFIGTLLGGWLIDRFGHWGKTLIWLSLVVTTLLTLLTPLVPYLGLLIFICLGQGTSLGVIDNIAQVLLLQLMTGDGGKECQPYMQALHAAFGIGAFISPLIISPFLGGEIFVDPNFTEDSTSPPTTNTTSTVTQRTASGSTTYHYAYFLIASSIFPLIVTFGYYMMRDERPIRKFVTWYRGQVEESGAWSSVDSNNGSSSHSNANGYTDDQIEVGDRGHLHAIMTQEEEIELGLARDPASEIEMDAVMREPDDDIPAGGHSNEDVVFRPDDSPTSGGSHGSGGGRRDSHANLLSPVVIPVQAINGGHDSNSSTPNTYSISTSPIALNGNETPEPLTEPFGLRLMTESDWMKWKLVILVSLFLLLYVGCESGYGGLIFTYSIKLAHLDPSHAAWLNAAFWFAFAVGRLIGIPVSLKLSSGAMIFMDLFGCILSLLCIIIFHDSVTMLWLGTLTYGLSVASIYPSAINYAESKVKLTGKILSVIVVAASCGDAIMPLLMGLSFDSPAGPLGMMLISMAVAVSALIIFAIIVGFVAPEMKETNHGDSTSERKRSTKKRKKKQTKHSVDLNGNGNTVNGANPSVSSSSTNQLHISPKPNRSDYSVVDLHDDDQHTLEDELDAELQRPSTPSNESIKHPSSLHQSPSSPTGSPTSSAFRSPIRVAGESIEDELAAELERPEEL